MVKPCALFVFLLKEGRRERSSPTSIPSHMTLKQLSPGVFNDSQDNIERMEDNEGMLFL